MGAARPENVHLEIAPRPLDVDFLPSNKNIIEYFLYLKTANYHKPLSFFLPQVARKVEEIWLQLPVPIKTYSGIRFKVNDILKNYQKEAKNSRRPICEKFLNMVCNIAKCQCNKQATTEDNQMQQLWIECNCADVDQIPRGMRPFFLDQLHMKRIKISTVKCSYAEPDIQPEPELHDQPEPGPELNFSTDTQHNDSTFIREIGTDPDFDPDDWSSDLSSSDHAEFIEPMPALVKSIRSLNLKEVAVEADRRNISNRDAAAIVNAGFVALGVISEHHRNLVVDEHKLRRERIKNRTTLAASIDDINPLMCFSFDGKKDDTLFKSNGGNHKITKKIENISIVQEPQHKFLGFISTECSKSTSVSEALLTFFQERNVPLTSLIAISSDGTNANTGTHAGIIHLIEKALNRPVHWFICMLHLCECLLRNVFTFLDGQTSGPTIYSGPIGQQLNDCDNKPIVKFKPIAFGVMQTTTLDHDFTNDQKMLLMLGEGINGGNENVDPKSINAKIGKLHKARWLTTASRVLRLYMSTKRPTSKLCKMVEFIMKVYIPAWFEIKRNPICTQGSLHIYRIITNSRCLDVNVINVVCQTLSRNAFFAHPENVLLCMITDPHKDIRKRAYEIILSCRNSPREGLRKFIAPQLNMSCNNYTDMIDWSKPNNIHEPPFTQNLSAEAIDEYMQSDRIITVPEFPCHSQQTEHCVQAVSEAVKKVAGNEQQIHFVNTKMHSRNMYSRFDSKKDWKF